MKKNTYQILYFVLFCFYLPLSAQAQTNWKASLGLEFDYYFQAIQNSDLKQSIVHIKPRLVYSSKTKNSKHYFFAEFASLLSSEVDDSHVYVPQLFFNYSLTNKKSKKIKLIFGRKKVSWSLLESDWQLGLFGSHFKINPLRPEQQGLIGLFYKQKNLNSAFTVFISPLAIPNQSGAATVKDGKIKIYNRWQSFVYYDKIPVAGKEKTFHYKLDKIDLYKLIQKWSIGVWTKKTFSNLHLSASYLYKPYSSPYVYPNISSTVIEPARIDILIKAKIINHHIAVLQAEYKQKYFSQYISFVFDQPEKINFLTGDKHSALAQKKIFAYGLKYKKANTKIALGAIYTQYQIVQQSILSDLAPKNINPDIYAYAYKNAVFIKANKKNIISALDSLSVKYTYLLNLKLDILSLQYKKYSKQHIWTLGLDILGHSFKEQAEGVFAINVANDFVYTGWTYVF